MTQGKKNPDGSKRRTSKRGASRLPKPADSPLRAGYERLGSEAVRGATDSVGAFVIQAFDKLTEGALEMFDKEDGFNSHGTAEVAFDAGAEFRVSFAFEIHGVPASSPDFRA